MSIDDTLAERGKVYGEFLKQASVACEIQDEIMRAFDIEWVLVDADIREALMMISVKIARIACGDERYVDNWRDIEGYAALVRKRLEGK